MASARFVIQYSSDRQFYFTLIASNNEVILTSEMYKSKDSAQNGIESVKTHAPLDDRYDRRTSTNDKSYFVLRANNNTIIGTSQMYPSKQKCEEGIEAVKRHAPGAELWNEG